MATATAGQHTSQPLEKCWDMAKDLDDSQKLELVQMLIESVKSAVAKAEEPEEDAHSLDPYTMEEINAMLDAAEADIAAGRVIDDEDAWDEWEEEISSKHEMAEAV